MLKINRQIIFAFCLFAPYHFSTASQKVGIVHVLGESKKSNKFMSIMGTYPCQSLLITAGVAPVAAHVVQRIKDFKKIMPNVLYTFYDLSKSYKYQSKYIRVQKTAALLNDMIIAYHAHKKPLYEARENDRYLQSSNVPGKAGLSVCDKPRLYHNKFYNLFKLRDFVRAKQEEVEIASGANAQESSADQYFVQEQYATKVAFDGVISAITKAIKNDSENIYAYLYDEKYADLDKKLSDFLLEDLHDFRRYKKLWYGKNGFPVNLSKLKNQLSRSEELVKKYKLNFDDEGNFLSEEIIS